MRHRLQTLPTYVVAMAALLGCDLSGGEIRAQTPGDYKTPYLRVRVIDVLTGQVVKETSSHVYFHNPNLPHYPGYDGSFEAEKTSLVREYRKKFADAARYQIEVTKTSFDASAPSREAPTSGVLDQRGLRRRQEQTPTRRTIAPVESPRPFRLTPGYNQPKIKFPDAPLEPTGREGQSPGASPKTYRINENQSNTPQSTSTNRFGYDDSLTKLPAPKGVTMRVGIDRGTLQRAAVSPRLLDRIRADK